VVQPGHSGYEALARIRLAHLSWNSFKGLCAYRSTSMVLGSIVDQLIEMWMELALLLKFCDVQL
jgi:hypothetical protein